MDNILDPAWQLGEKPFHAESLILEDWIPVPMLRQALLALVGGVQERYGDCGLYYFVDRHEKDGQLSRRQRSSYAALRALLESDRQLYETRPQPEGVYHGFYSETHDFLLRYGLRAALPPASMIWGDFSLSASSDDIRRAIAQLKPIDGLPLNLIGSAAYFDAVWGR